MTPTLHQETGEGWTLSDGQVVGALGCDAVLGESIVEALTYQNWTVPAPAQRLHAPRACVGFAIAHVLHCHAGLALRDAASVVGGCAAVMTSVLNVIEFEPEAAISASFAEIGAASTAPDPFMLFAPHAAEAVPIAAIDEYLDVVDGRRIFWRQPRRSPYALACELHRLSSASRQDDVPALQEAYLEALCRLREPADHVCDWIGTVADGRFLPAPNRFPERTPFMRQGPGGPAKQSFADCYGTKVSVNISLAARSMKRRALGLAVAEPCATRTSPFVQQGSPKE
jgi:hypothetical protein